MARSITRAKKIIDVGCKTQDKWTDFLCQRTNHNIGWECTWWRCDFPMFRSPGWDHIFLVGLRITSFYKYDRLLRQFGLEHVLILGHTNSFVATDVTPTVKAKVEPGLLDAHRADRTFARLGLIGMTEEFVKFVEGQTSTREKTSKKEWTNFLKDFIPKNEKKMRQGNKGLEQDFFFCSEYLHFRIL